MRLRVKCTSPLPSGAGAEALALRRGEDIADHRSGTLGRLHDDARRSRSVQLGRTLILSLALHKCRPLGAGSRPHPAKSRVKVCGDGRTSPTFARSSVATPSGKQIRYRGSALPGKWGLAARAEAHRGPEGRGQALRRERREEHRLLGRRPKAAFPPEGRDANFGSPKTGTLFSFQFASGDWFLRSLEVLQALDYHRYGLCASQQMFGRSPKLNPNRD